MIHQASPVGEILRRLRKRAGEAAGLRYTGVAHAIGWGWDRNIAQYETGRSPLSLEMACRFAFVYRVAPSVLDSRLSSSVLESPDQPQGTHERLRLARVNAAMYPRELALKAFGKPYPDRIKEWESGKYVPHLWKIYAIAAAVQCPPSSLDHRLTDVIPPPDVVPLRPSDVYARGM